MKDSRIGESLWYIWDSINSPYGDYPIFYTEGHVDVDNEVVRRALASAIQREGIVSSLGEGFFMIDHGDAWQGYSGSTDVGNVEELHVCDTDGITEDGEPLPEFVPTTWVRIFDF
jgi:ABC-type transport system substrate-binding protein